MSGAMIWGGPTAIGSTSGPMIWGGPGGGSIQYNATATFGSHPALARSTYQVQPIDTSGGAFAETMPTGATAGDVVIFKDVAVDPALGVYTNACTVAGAGGATVQNKHTKAMAATYVFARASGDTGGDSIGFRFDGTNWGAMATC